MLVNCQMFPVIIFWLNILKGTAKAPAVDFLTLNTLRGKKNRFFHPLKRYGKYTRPFYVGVPTPSTVGYYMYVINAF